MNYYLWFNDSEYGPYTQHQLQESFNNGEINPQTLARTEEGLDWLPLHQVVRLEGHPTALMPKPRIRVARPTSHHEPAPAATPVAAPPTPAPRTGAEDDGGASFVRFLLSLLLGAGMVITIVAFCLATEVGDIHNLALAHRQTNLLLLGLACAASGLLGLVAYRPEKTSV